MIVMTIPVIKISGGPFDLGYAHGEKAKEAIKKNFEFYLGFWNYWSGVKRQELLKEAQKFIPYIEKLDPELIEELKGVAQGAEMGFEEIIALNSRYEVSYAYIPTAPTKIAWEGCTAYALRPEATKSHHTIVGQNWDFRPGLKDSCLILHIQQVKKPDIIMHTEAGIIGHKGFNSKGIGVCFNVIKSEKDIFRPGLPLWIKARGILNSESLPDCVRMLMTFEGPNSANMVIAHRDGEAIDVECTPNDNFFLFPEKGILTHTNHFRSPDLRCKDTGKIMLPDTVIRNQRAFRLFEDRREALNSDSIKEVMTDHFGKPNSICRHRDERLNPNEQWETLTSMIMDLTEGKLLYTNGPPCLNPYKSIGFDN
jgi:isopenicillin-N N-acyltransferase-like protein